MTDSQPRTDPAAPRRRLPQAIALAVAALGAVLMAYMIVVESEPGLLPLLLVAGGLVAFAVVRRRR